MLIKFMWLQEGDIVWTYREAAGYIALFFGAGIISGLLGILSLFLPLTVLFVPLYFVLCVCVFRLVFGCLSLSPSCAMNFFLSQELAVVWLRAH